MNAESETPLVVSERVALTLSGIHVKQRISKIRASSAKPFENALIVSVVLTIGRLIRDAAQAVFPPDGCSKYVHLAQRCGEVFQYIFDRPGQ
ncbi:hypothetical protein [Trinickia fusca]|uniref:hypothetical protein n=1 Tax=Trinickia fusca TaxID=2419777 RepID=UPI0011C41FA5|nr:hypothetical protein [Trinickia fusca]